MSRPRKPYGPNPPGRLQGTMIKVLAAEMSDPGRLARGKRYWSDDAVVDITIGHGAVTAEVQGGRAQPYVVTLEAGGGTGVPNRRDLWVQCTCPDDSGTGSDACKHAVAALFALADEVAIEPALVERWRAGRGPRAVVSDDRAAGPDPTEVVLDAVEQAWDAEPGRPVRPDRSVVDLDRERRRRGVATAAPVDVEAAAIASLLSAPTGVVAGDLPDPEPIAHLGIRDPTLAAALDDALDQLDLRWE